MSFVKVTCPEAASADVSALAWGTAAIIAVIPARTTEAKP
jgi:hypothetical protein